MALSVSEIEPLLGQSDPRICQFKKEDNKIFRTIFRTVPGNLKKCSESLLSEMVSL